MGSFFFQVLLFNYCIAVLLLAYYLHWYYLSQQLFSLASHNSVLTYDFIVVGAGSAGSVIARRLAEDAGHSVLLLEAGGSPSAIMNVPVLTPLLQLSDFDWQYRTEPQSSSCLGLKDKRSRWPRGKVLGGSSRLNFLVYLRGDSRDFDEWEEKGNPGWSYQDVLPFFKKAENQQGSYRHDKVHHGSKGPLIVSDGSWVSSLASAFLKAGAELGYEAGDLNGPLKSGFMLTQLAMERGQRHTCDAAYLNERPNLHVLTHAHVNKVLFRGGNEAYAVQFHHRNELKVAVATKEIILSGGALNSPHILMLSGVGPKEHLKHHKISAVVDLEGVGQNLQDHVTTAASIVSHSPTLSLEALASPLELWNYLSTGTGPLTSAGCEALALVHTNISSDLRPDVQLMLMPLGFSTDCGTVLRHMIGINEEIWEKFFQPLCGQSTASMFVVLLRPFSVGQLRLQSSDSKDPLLIDPKYLTHPKDMKTMVQAMHFVERLVTSPALSDMGVSLNSMHLPGCESMPFGSDDYWECYIRHLTLTTYHPSGTCAMGPANQKGSVVDNKLRVHGVKKLRVVDASIMPSIVGANINAATMMIAEKASHLLRMLWWNSCTWRDLLLSVYQCLPEI